MSGYGSNNNVSQNSFFPIKKNINMNAEISKLDEN